MFLHDERSQLDERSCGGSERRAHALEVERRVHVVVVKVGDELRRARRADGRVPLGADGDGQLVVAPDVDVEQPRVVARGQLATRGYKYIFSREEDSIPEVNPFA